MCPGWLKWQLASDWVKRAEEGSPGVKELLRLTPCDLFSYIRDRTLWLIGDSLTLVRYLECGPEHANVPHICSK